MKKPTFDADGYPSDETLDAIELWSIEGKLAEWLEFCESSWNKHYGAVRHQGQEVEFVTGGWSGNESVLSAMPNHPFYYSCWLSSHRGGLHRFTTEHASF